MLFKDTNQIKRNYYLNLFSANAEIKKNGNNNYLYEWNIRDLQLGKYAEIALVQLASINADYTVERQYPPKAYNSRTSDTTTSTNILNKTTIIETITLNTSGITYGFGTYEIYCSSRVNTGEPMYKALLFNYTNNDTHGAQWQDGNYTDGVYNKSNFIVSDYTGEWIVIKLPSPIILTKFTFELRVSAYGPDTFRTPAEWKCYGSNDGITFDEIKSASNLNRLTINDYINRIYTKIVNTKKPYLYIGFVINKTLTGATQLNFMELQLFGRELLNIMPPVMWYKFDGSATDMLLDSSGNNYHLTNSGATFDGSNFKRGYGSISFNIGNFLSNSSVLNLNSKDFSISCWVYVKSTNTFNWIFSLGNGSTIRTAILLGRFNNNTYIFSFGNDDLYSGAYAADVNNWVHICATYKTGTRVRKIYRNGVEIASGTSGGETNTNSLLYIGREATGGSYDGNIDDLRIYNYVLSPNEISRLYNGTDPTTQNKYIIRSLNTYNDGWDSQSQTSAVLYMNNELKSPKQISYHKINTYDLNRISLQVSNDIDTNRPYNGWKPSIEFGCVLHIINYGDN